MPLVTPSEKDIAIAAVLYLLADGIEKLSKKCMRRLGIVGMVYDLSYILRQLFMNLETITGHLFIAHSTQMSSLDFLPALKVIKNQKVTGFRLVA